MSDEIPSMDEVFEAFAQWNEAIDPEDFRPEFDRFIAKVKADVLREAAGLFAFSSHISFTGTCIRDRINEHADRIEGEVWA